MPPRRLLVRAGFKNPVILSEAKDLPRCSNGHTQENLHLEYIAAGPNPHSPSSPLHRRLQDFQVVVILSRGPQSCSPSWRPRPRRRTCFLMHPHFLSCPCTAGCKLQTVNCKPGVVGVHPPPRVPHSTSPTPPACVCPQPGARGCARWNRTESTSAVGATGK